MSRRTKIAKGVKRARSGNVDGAPHQYGGDNTADVEAQMLDACWHLNCADELPNITYNDMVVSDLCELIHNALVDSTLITVPRGDEEQAQWAHLTRQGLDPNTPNTAPTTADLDNTATTASYHNRYVFYMDLNHPAMRGNPAVEVLIEMPETSLPIIAFYRSVVEYRTHLAEQHTSPHQFNPNWCLKTEPFVVNGPQTPLHKLCAATLGKLVFLTGTVMRLSSPSVCCKMMAFLCGQCGKTKYVDLKGGPLEFPSSCDSGRCRGVSFTLVPSEAVCEEVQTLKIQGLNLAEVDSRIGGDASRSIDVELRDPLMELASPGDVVTVAGIVITKRGEKQFAGSHQVCMRANSLISHTLRKSSAAAVKTGEQGSAQRSVKQLLSIGGGTCGGDSTHDAVLGDNPITGPAFSSHEAGPFYEAVQDPAWFDRLASSVVPSIYGHADLKAAIVLAMVGGSDRSAAGEASGARGGGGVSGGVRQAPRRSNIHLLMMGDPGMGKSQVLKAACQLSPRHAYVCANTSSACGLTVSLSRDPVSGETTFDAGAVVHGDEGLTCIDEIDKGASEHKALLEVMEQESISIAKAGMVFSMPIRTTVFAAGNPSGGKFDPYKSLAENINMTSALLSRFDVVYVMKDTHTPSHSQGGGDRLTNHVLRIHQGGAREAGQSGAATGNTLPLSFVSRFIAFARKEHQPLLSPEAADILKSEYLARRGHKSAVSSAMPGSEPVLSVTPRFLQSLIRLSEAHAKAHLRSVVTPEDAYAVVQLLDRCNRGVGLGDRPSGLSQLNKPLHHATRKKLNQTDAVIQQISTTMASSSRNNIHRNEILEICAEVGCKNPNATLHQLSDAGLLFQDGPSHFRLRTRLAGGGSQ